MKKQRLWIFAILLSSFLVVGGAPTVFAQDKTDAAPEEMETMMLDEIIVTGSRIGRSDITSMSPISVFTETDILISGYVTIEDFVQNIPAITGGFYGNTVNNGNPGYATASLRGLGSNRTLVLLNGRRMPSAGSNGFVDLNMIPVGIVERVEVLRDGASTAYGSDAIAGVVNIITKRDFKGAEFQFQYDVSGENDGGITQGSGLFGMGSDRGNVVFGVDYTKREKIMQGDREFSECPLFEEADGSTYCGGSGTSYPGQFFNDNYDGHVLVNDVITPFDGGAHGFNYAKWSYMVTPQEVLSTYANASYDLVQESPIGTVTAFSEFVWTNRQSDQLMAAVGTFWAPAVPATNPYNPTGEEVYVARRLFETGGRSSTQDASSWRLVVGLEGDLPSGFAEGWKWDVTYTYSRWVDSRIHYGFINTERVDNALDPALCAADSECPEVWDPFRVGTLNGDLQKYILVDHSPVQRSEMKTLQINVSGDLGGFELPGGPVQWAVGYEKREEEALFQPDGAGAMNLIYFVSPDKTEGDYSVSELYGEVRAPILKELPFADILAAEISVRSSDYDNLDDTTTNWKFALEWGPIPDLRFRGVFAEGFRSANLGELFDPQQLSAQQYNDPCVNYGSGASATVAANCAADGLPPDFQLTSNQASSILGGNPDLEPEESESMTIGVVIAPEMVPNLTVSLDWFNIKITNAIGTAGTNNIITGCYESANFSSFWCDYIPGPTHPFVGDAPHATSPYRDAIGAVSGVLLTNANLADYETEGIDFAINYVWEFSTSVLNLGVMGTWLDKYDYTPFEGADVVQLAGFFGEDHFTANPATFPEWKVNFNIQYVMGDWSFTWAPRWMDAVTDINADKANGDNEAESIWYNDVQATYDYKGWSFALGVRNLLDEDPPYVTNYDDMNTIQFSYDTAGRYFYARVGYSF